MIRCGMSEVDITPPLGLPIPGYFRPRTATGVLDELCAKAMVVDDGNRKIAFVVVDAIALERAEVERIRRRVEQWTGIAPHHVMVSATHTHTGGPVYRQPPYDHEEYLSMVAQKAADAIVLADQRLRPAQIGFGREKVKGVSFNRGYFMKDGTLMTNPGVLNPDIVGPEGPVDDELAVIRVDDAQGNPIGAVINFALHLDTVGGNLYSADYPGHISRVLKATIGGTCRLPVHAGRLRKCEPYRRVPATPEKSAANRGDDRSRRSSRASADRDDRPSASRRQTNVFPFSASSADR